MVFRGERKRDRSSSEYKDGTIVIDCQLFARSGEIMRKSDSLMGGSGKFYSDNQNPSPTIPFSTVLGNLKVPRSSILDPRYSILDTRSSILDPRYSILDPRSSILVSSRVWRQENKKIFTRFIFHTTRSFLPLH